MLDAVEGTVPLCRVATALSGSREKPNEKHRGSTTGA